MDKFVNLNEAGALSQSGRGYSTVSDDQSTEAGTFLSHMEASEPGLRGAAGTTFRNAAGMSSGNLTQLANLIAEQAARAVLGENVILGSDDDAAAAQQGALSQLDAQGVELSRSIEA